MGGLPGRGNSKAQAGQSAVMEEQKADTRWSMEHTRVGHEAEAGRGPVLRAWVAAPGWWGRGMATDV